MRIMQFILGLFLLGACMGIYLPGGDRIHELLKRKGGGRGSVGGGTTGGSSGSGSGSTGFGSGSSGSASRGSTGFTGGTYGRSYVPAVGGYYPGGTLSPYRSGIRSPLGIAPVFLALPLLGFWGGGWAGGAYNYPYGRNVTYPDGTHGAADCLCAVNAECGCDNNTNSGYLSALPSNVTKIATVNGTRTLFINGTLPDGVKDASMSAAAAIMHGAWWSTGILVAMLAWSC